MLRLVINLDRSPDRWKFISQQFYNLNLPVTRVSGVDGYKLSTETQLNLQPPLKEKWEFPRRLLPGEIGCYLSHIKCWKTLIESDESWALVIEDDVQISTEAKKFFNDASWIPSGIELVQPFAHSANYTMKVAKKEYTVLDGRKLFHPFKPYPIGTIAYFISRKCAKDALLASSKLGMPVDEFMFGPMSSWAKKHPVWKLNPTLVLPAEFDSTINQSNIKNQQVSSAWAWLSPRRHCRKVLNSLRHILFSKKETFVFK